jgi:hypothetical protein
MAADHLDVQGKIGIVVNLLQSGTQTRQSHEEDFVPLEGWWSLVSRTSKEPPKVAFCKRENKAMVVMISVRAI